jgi:arylsulfatase A-like enzyme/Flp pilus assembly protein TadD
LLVTLDTFRADRVGAYGHAGGLTPNLDRLAREGVRFDAAWSTVPLTLPSHATMLVGLLPPAHGLRQNGSGALPAATPTLATQLAARGARAAAFVSAYVLHRRFGLDRGFATYDDAIPQRPGRPAGMEAQRPGRETVDRALAWLEGNAASGEPIFLWVHLFDAHAPYEPPEPFASAIAEPYDGEIAEVDAQLGRLLAAFEARGLLADTLVAVAGDHGEALGEHGERSHGLLLYEPTLRVPLVLRGRGLEAGGVVREPVSLVDLAPTVIDLLGAEPIPLAADGRSGRSLAPSLRRGVEPPAADLYAETEYPRLLGWSGLAALRRGALKFVAAPEPELYDLSTDPGEAVNRIDADRRAAAAMRGALDALRRDAVDLATAPLDEEGARALVALGYVGGSPVDPKRGAADPKRMAPLFARLEQAREAMEAGRLEESAADLSRLVDADPGNPVFRGTRAAVLGRLGRKGLAVEELRRSLVGGPGDLQTLYDLALALHEAGLPADAAKTLDELLRRDPEHAEGWNARGLLELEEGRLAAARASFERAVKLDRANANAVANLGNALRAAGLLDDAELALRHAVELAPDWADPLNGLGALEVGRGRVAEGLELFERALRLDPSRHEVRLNRAIALDSLGRRGEAAAAYREFLAVTRGERAYAESRRAAEALLARLERR